MPRRRESRRRRTRHTPPSGHTTGSSEGPPAWSPRACCRVCLYVCECGWAWVPWYCPHVTTPFSIPSLAALPSLLYPQLQSGDPLFFVRCGCVPHPSLFHHPRSHLPSLSSLARRVLLLRGPVASMPYGRAPTRSASPLSTPAPRPPSLLFLGSLDVTTPPPPHPPRPSPHTVPQCARGAVRGAFCSVWSSLFICSSACLPLASPPVYYSTFPLGCTRLVCAPLLG